MSWRRFLIGIWLLVAVQCPFVHAAGPCDLVLRITAQGFVIWDSTTHRAYKVYLETFGLMRRHGVFEAGMPEIAINEIINGKQSVLSLGEGDGTFVLTLLQGRRKKLGGTDPITNIVAVDEAYLRPERERLPHVYDAVSGDFQANYKGGLFQELDIKENGQRKQFDRIVSSNSLGYILSEAPKEQARATLSRVMEHLKPGGTLLIWGHYLEVKDMDPHGLFRELGDQGELKLESAYFSRDFYKTSYLIIQKPTVH